MGRLEMDTNVADKELKRLCQIWEFQGTGHYWYPLSSRPVNRQDIVTFWLGPGLYLTHGSILEIFDPHIDVIRSLLLKRGTQTVYEFWGNGKACFQDLTANDNVLLWRDEEYFDNGNEGFWCSSQMDWVMYVTHEKTLTIGGDWLLKELQTEWKKIKPLLDELFPNHELFNYNR